MEYAMPGPRTLAGAMGYAERRPVLDRVGNTSAEVIFVTNRGPVEHAFDKRGALCTERGAGGVVSGLLCAAEGRRVSWISLAMTDADRVAAQRAESRIIHSSALPNVGSRLVDVPPVMYQRHYDGFSNRVLWFLQHDLAPDGTWAADDLDVYWRDGYAPTNEAVAEAVIEELVACKRAGAMPPVVFHDYHLYLAPAIVRQRMPSAKLQHFVHIPWPSYEVWQRLSERLVRGIYAGLAANDVIGFQTERDMRNFLTGAARYLPGAQRTGRDTLRWEGREVRVAAYPIAVTPQVVRAKAHTAEAERAADEILAPLGLERGRKLILRVDRVEPTKNIVRGFEAYERLLSEHKALRERVVFLALLVPSRESLPVYQHYAERVQATIERINARFGTRDWQPIVAVYGNDHARALACMRLYDVLLVNPLVDGMNLVVKEGAIVNERAGTIVLSTGAGAHDQLAAGVLSVEPRDVSGTAEALWQALSMPTRLRAALTAQTHRVVWSENAEEWLRRQLADLARAGAGRGVDARVAAYTRPLDLGLLLPDGAGNLADGTVLQMPLRDGGRDTVPLD